GDPLARALADDVLIDRVALVGVELAPRVTSWGPSGELTRVAGEAETGETPGALLRVSATGVSLAYAPRVSFDRSGRPRLVGAGPLPDAPARVDFPEEPRPFIRPIDEVVALLRSVPEGVTLAVGATAEVPTHLLYRVIESAQAADVPVDAIAAVSADGRLRTRPLEVRHEWPESHVKVFVRLGGYTVSVGRHRMELARRRTDTGWEHDTARLRQTVAGADRPLALRAMWAAPASLVLEAAFAEAASEPFAVVIR
ncbi:MAG: hypothetical protein CMH59_23855, partial [Myxococcales bacterium]|nr:hypothetical protein [Myxococcales bacterium]